MQTNGKLFIQQELLSDFGVQKTALIISIIMFSSRVVRILSNALFKRTHNKYKDTVGYMLPVFLFLGIAFMAGGSFIPYFEISRVIIMALGYTIILFIRDPFRTYIQDLALKNSDKELHQSIFVTFAFARKIARSIMSLCITMLLVKEPMVVIMILLAALSVIEIAVSIYLYRMLNKNQISISQ